jgi:hypothetical protein
VAKRQSQPRLPKTPADKLRMAQQDFILAMYELGDQGIPNNPLSALVEEVLREWQSAGTVSPGTPKRFRYLSSEQSDAIGAARRERRKQIIEDWARRFWLLGTDRQPADWIVAYAQKLCQKLSGEWREGPTRLGRLNSAPGEPAPAHKWIGLLAIPMADPDPREGEPFCEFKKRARRALTVHLRALATKQVRQFTAPRPPKVVSKIESHRLDHFKWLVLFQCCEWQQHRILTKYSYVGSYQAISVAIRRTAALLGISVRQVRAANLTQQEASSITRKTLP